MAQNIQMNVKQEDGSYEVVYPQTISQNITDLQDNYYNKEQILTQTVSDMFEISSGNPNDVFEFLGKYNQYWWKALKKQYTVKTKDIIINYNVPTAIQYSEEVYYDSNGIVHLKSPINTSVSATYSGAQKLANLSPCYIQFSDQVYFLPSGSTYGTSGSETVGFRSSPQASVFLSVNATKKASIAYTVISFNDPVYEQSSDRNKYPDFGDQGEYSYQYLGVPFNKFVETVRVSTGSYIGDGKSGSSYPNRLNIGFIPKIILINPNSPSANGQTTFTAMLLPEMKVFASSNNALYMVYNTLSIIAGGVEWYVQDNPQAQCNINGVTYYYIAFG